MEQYLHIGAGVEQYLHIGAGVEQYLHIGAGVEQYLHIGAGVDHHLQCISIRDWCGTVSTYRGWGGPPLTVYIYQRLVWNSIYI